MRAVFVCVFPFCSSSSISSYILCLIFVFIFVLVFSSPLFPSFFIAVVVGTEYILHSTTTSPAAASQSFPPNWDRPHDCRSSTFRCVGAIVCKNVRSADISTQYHCQYVGYGLEIVVTRKMIFLLTLYLYKCFLTNFKK